jgi:hypothetical protein
MTSGLSIGSSTKGYGSSWRNSTTGELSVCHIYATAVVDIP